MRCSTAAAATPRDRSALCEVQAYVYGAKRHASRLAAALGALELADQLHAQAQLLQQNFEARFWCEELSVYAIALGRGQAAMPRR